MCDPVSALAGAELAVGIGGAIVSHKAQNKQAKATKQAALTDLSLQRQDLSAREIEEKTSVAGDIQNATLQTQAAEGLTRAGAAEGGVAGMAIDALIGTQEGQLAGYKAAEADNLNVTLDQIQRARKGAEAQAQARINGAQGSSGLALGLQIAGAGIDFGKYIIGQSRKPAGT